MASNYEVDDRELLLGLYRKVLFAPVLSLVPRRVSPNSITIAGVACSTLSVPAALAAVAGQPQYYIVSALSLLFYLTADNVDGPHARRTGRSSILGEFLDHGLDGVASGSVLLTAAVILRMDGIYFLLLAWLGAIGFAMPFWEQFKTGVLVIPEMSSTEGITLVALLDLLLYFAGEPLWLRFSMAELNLTTGVLLFALVCYVIAIFVPIVRVARAGHSPRGLIAPLLLSALSLLYVPAGALPILPSLLVSVLGADLTCRMIAVRHGHRGRVLLSPWDGLVLLPLVPAFLTPDVLPADGWAALAALLALVRYLGTLLGSGAHMRALDRDKPA